MAKRAKRFIKNTRTSNKKALEHKHSEIFLRESEDFFRVICDHAPTMLWMCGTDKLCKFVNKSWLKFSGKPFEQELGYGWAQELHPDDLQHCLDTYTSAFDARKDFRMEHRMKRADGEYRWILATGTPYYLADGNFAGYIGSCVDITKLKESEEKLREVEEKCLPFETSHDAIFIADVESGTIINTNKRAEDMLGYSREEIIGMHQTQLHPEEEVARYSKIFKEHVQSGKGFSRDLYVRHKNGSKIPVEISASVTSFENKKIILGIFRDITERKKAEEEIKNLLIQQKAILEIGQHALASNELSTLFNKTVILVARTLEVEFSKVLELLPDGKKLILRAGIGWEKGFVGQATVDAGKDSQAGYTLLSKEPVVVDDLNTETRFHGSNLLRDHGIVCGISVIIQGTNKPFGVLGAHTTKRQKFTIKDIHFLQEVANILAVAVERNEFIEKLQKSEQRLELAIWGTDLGLWDWNVKTGKIFFSQRWIEMLGYTPNEIEPNIHSWGKLIHPEDIRGAIKNLRSHLRRHTPFYKAEQRLLTKSGEWISVLSRGKVVEWDSNGKPSRIVGTNRDITIQKKVEDQLINLSRAVEQSPITVMVTDVKGNIEYVNPKFSQLTGYTKEEVIGQNPRILKSSETPRELHKRLWSTIISGNDWHGEMQNIKKDGSLYWEHIVVSPIKNPKGVITHFVAVMEDITERKKLDSQLIYLANHDSLTNLFNRRRFYEELEGKLALLKRHGMEGALLLLDIDNFKDINDTLGHPAGDEILIKLAALLRKLIRKTDVIARLGGDEFAIALLGINASNAESISNQIKESVRQHAVLGERQSFYITISIGIALFPQHSDSIETLLTYADLAMYQAKEEGRNRICIYATDQITKIKLRHHWEIRIREALDHDLFMLYLQPIVDLRHNCIAGFETLLRMKGEGEDLIYPSQFLKIAEHSKFISEINQIVVQKALKIIDEIQHSYGTFNIEVQHLGKRLRKGF
ncbi:MAG: PAS domain S-box protein [Candidatus Brocadiales bacterium]|nr:PAS domain S-box protein [Candidatus Brocadiales bacterium]